MSILKQANKSLKSDDMIALWNYMLDNVESNVVVCIVLSKLFIV